MSEPSLKYLQEQNSRLEKELSEARSRPPGDGAGGDGGSHMADVKDRVTRLEGEMGGLKHGQTQLLVSMGVVSAVLIGVGIYTLSELSSLSTKTNDLALKVAALPGQINSGLLDISKTLAEVIIATKQTDIPPPKR
jgi:hypothetical protein